MTSEKTLDSLLIEHLGYSAGIERWTAIKNHLVEQVYKNKSAPLRGKSEPSDDKKVETIALVGMYLERKTQSSMDNWPVVFKRSMKDVYFQEMKELGKIPTIDDTDVYWSFGLDDNPHCDTQEKLSAFDPNEWRLEDTADITLADTQVIKKFKNGFFSFIDALFTKASILDKYERAVLSSEISSIKHDFDYLSAVLDYYFK
jgi:hypothetical protein